MLKSLVHDLLRRIRGGTGDLQGDREASDRLQACVTEAVAQAAAGKHAAAASLYREAAEWQPQNPRIWCNLGVELQAAGQPAEAEHAFRHALELDTDLAPAWYNLARLQQETDREDEAEAGYRSALERLDATQDHELWQLVYNNWGRLLQTQGRFQEAVGMYREALRAFPADASLRSNLLFLLTTMPDVDEAELLEEHRTWGKLHARTYARHDNSPDPARRIRVGYVSADFYSHPLAFFLLPVLTNHERAHTEVVCYYTGKIRDAVTARLHASADLWRDIGAMTDAEVEHLIRADAIDILVDLSGHTVGNRLSVFAGKPAPVQLTWLGYANTTGVQAMDYRITDAYADPRGPADRRYVEKLLRMPGSMWCYEPQLAAPLANAPPMLDRGYVTFACFNNAYKLNQPLIETWASILHAVLGSRLMLVNVPAGRARERIVSWLQLAGIDSDRLELHAHLPTRDFWAAHGHADIALDPFPCNGGATTCETLWLGVPVITLAGSKFVGRAGVSLLTNCGLPQLIADSRAQYIDLAVGLAQDAKRLQELRLGLRARLLASPLLDGPEFTRALEAHYRGIWRDWCIQRDRGHA